MIQKRSYLVWAAVVVAGALVYTGTQLWSEKTVIVTVDGQTAVCATRQNTVAALLHEKGIRTGLRDRIQPEPDSIIREDMKIAVVHGIPVEINANGEKRTVWTVKRRVKDILRQARITAGPEDLVIPGRTELVGKTQSIKVVRVSRRVVEEEQAVPFQVERISDPALEKGLTKTLRQGELGLARRSVRITYYDGQEVRREVLSSRNVREPMNQVMADGSITNVSRGSLRLAFARALIAESTAYTYTGHRTASGMWPAVGLVAVDTRIIPMGTRLYIEGYGFARAADRGGAIVGHKVDVFLETVSNCKQWGRKKVKVYVLN